MMTVERKREKARGSHLLAERAIEWLEVVLHVLTNEAQEDMKGKGVLSFLLTEIVVLEQDFQAIERFKTM